ncbi:hypothetical protein GCM10027053_26530 [Intrasporangium mesophilum]
MTGRRSMVRRALATCGLVLALSSAACSSPGGAAAPRGSATATVRPQYVALADAVVAQHGSVWVETDLLKAWRSGPARYETVLSTVSSLANRPGVAGVKIADELGYDDGTDPGTVLTFLKATTAALHSRLHGRKVLVDFIVPELGCLSWQRSGAASATADAGSTSSPEAECGAREIAKNPAASLAAVDSYVAKGGLDVIDLSPGLRSDAEYAAWGTTRDAAMAAVWDEASRRWGGMVRLQARKALAHPGPYAGTPATAEADVRTFVDIPLAHGAKAVDIWTWSQPYKGATYTITDPGLQPNPLVEALRSRRARGVDLWTHMTPSSLQSGLQADVESALTLFSTVFVASGTG